MVIDKRRLDELCDQWLQKHTCAASNAFLTEIGAGLSNWSPQEDVDAYDVRPPGVSIELAQLVALVEKWRDVDTDGHAHDPAVAFAEAQLQCADELSAVISKWEPRS